MVIYHLSMFGSHWSSLSGDIMYLISRVISKDHMIEESCNFMNERSSLYVSTLPSLVTIDSGSGDMLLIFHMISKNHVIKGLCDFKGKSNPRLATTLPSLVTIGIVLVENTSSLSRDPARPRD